MKKLKELAEDKSEEETGPVSVEFLGKKVDFSLASEEEEKKFWQDFQNKQFGGKKTQKWQRKFAFRSHIFYTKSIFAHLGGKKRFHDDNGGRKNKVSKTEAGGD